MTEAWRNLIADRHENGMFRAKSPLPVIKREPELPKPVVVETIPSNTQDIDVPKVENIDNPNIVEITEEKVEVQQDLQQEPQQDTKVEDQAAEEKLDSNIDEVDVSKLVSSVGAHKTLGLKIGWVENKSKNKSDFQSIEWGKESNISFVVGRVQFPVPMFWDAEGHKIHLEDIARGSSVILVGNNGQPYAGHHYISVNQSFGSQIRIITSSFEDINIKSLKSSSLKIMPLEYARKIRSDGVYNFHSPFNCYFMRNSKYQRNDFWYEDCFFSDQTTGFGDLITSLRILFVMGYRTVYLDGFTSSSNDFAIYDDVIKNAVGKMKILDIGNNGSMRGVEKFNRAKAMASCIL
ncbi:hypothetical protein CCP1ISM_20012 [Azospirillaceae bacterium]